MEEKKAPKKRLGLKKEAPEAFMASFFAGLEVYQTKMLVRCFPHCSFKITTVTLSTNTNLLDIKNKDDDHDYLFTELPGKKFLQSPLLGTFCCLCYQLYSSLLQSKFGAKLPLYILTLGSRCFVSWVSNLVSSPFR